MQAEDPDYLLVEHVITSAGFGTVDWGDGYGLEPDSVFELACERYADTAELRRKPIRPARQATAETAPAAEPEAGL